MPRVLQTRAVADNLRPDGTRWDQLSLVREATTGQRRAVMRAGVRPDFASLAGWEFAGINCPWVTTLVGIRKFKKGFYRGPSRGAGPEPFIQGYNVGARQDGIDRPPVAKPSEERPKRYGFYRVYAADAGPRRHHDHALLLDYGRGGNFALDPAGLLRDYLVQVYPDDPDLLLGHAFGAVGVWVPVAYFVLQRMNEHDFEG